MLMDCARLSTHMIRIPCIFVQIRGVVTWPRDSSSALYYHKHQLANSQCYGHD